MEGSGDPGDPPEGIAVPTEFTLPKAQRQRATNTATDKTAGSSTSDRKRKSDEDGDLNPSNYKVTVRNKYQPLSDIEGSSDEEVQTPAPQQSKRAPPRKTLPPPPIVLHDIHEHRMLTKLIGSAVEGTYNIKYTREGTSIFVSSASERKVLIQKLQEFKINFHTYTDRNEKTASYVLKGLSKGTKTNEILLELEEKYKITPKRCIEMKSTGAPFYLVTVPNTVTRQQLGAVETIDRTRIRWESYHTSKRITQCHRCQSWGHATANCFAKPRCLKCAETHFTHECVKTKDTAAKCANCHGDHPASATSCPLFLKRKSWLDDRASRLRDQRQPITRPPPDINGRDFPPLRTFAPAPAANPWSRGAVRAAPESSPSTSAITRPSSTARPQPPTKPDQNPAGPFKELALTMQELNALICIK